MNNKELLEQKNIELDKEEQKYTNQKREKKFYWGIVTGCMAIIAGCTAVAAAPGAIYYGLATLIPAGIGVVQYNVQKGKHNKKVAKLNTEIQALSNKVQKEEFEASKTKYFTLSNTTIYEDVKALNEELTDEKVKTK